MIKERAEELKRQAEESGPGVKPKKATKQPLKVFRQGVGKYLNLQVPSTSAKAAKNEAVPAKKSKDKNFDFGNFDSW